MMKKTVLIICSVISAVLAAFSVSLLVAYVYNITREPISREIHAYEVSAALKNEFGFENTDMSDVARSYYDYTDEQMASFKNDFGELLPSVSVDKDYAIYSLRSRIGFIEEYRVTQIGPMQQIECAARQRILAAIQKDLENDKIEAWTALYAEKRESSFELPNKDSVAQIIKDKYENTPDPVVIAIMISVTVVLIALIMVAGLLISKKAKA